MRTGAISAQMKPKLPELFGTLPKAPLEVVAMPDYMAQGPGGGVLRPGHAGWQAAGAVWM